MPRWRKWVPSSGGVFEPHTIHMPQLHITCLQSRLDIDSDDSHPSCVAQPICRCQEQSCAQDTEQIQGNHESIFSEVMLQSCFSVPFVLLVFVAPACALTLMMHSTDWLSQVITSLKRKECVIAEIHLVW